MKHKRRIPRDGFTLIELMIVVAIIAIIAAIAIPNLMNAKRKSNQSAVMQTLNSFYKAAFQFTISTEANAYWEADTADFGEYFLHKNVKFGFEFRYFSNDTAYDDVHNASRFLYLAVPISRTTGRRAYYSTEENSLIRSNVLTTAQIAAVKALVVGDINFAQPALSRINLAGVSWELAR